MQEGTTFRGPCRRGRASGEGRAQGFSQQKFQNETRLKFTAVCCKHTFGVQKRMLVVLCCMLCSCSQ